MAIRGRLQGVVESMCALPNGDLHLSADSEFFLMAFGSNKLQRREVRVGFLARIQAAILMQGKRLLQTNHPVYAYRLT